MKKKVVCILLILIFILYSLYCILGINPVLADSLNEIYNIDNDNALVIGGAKIAGWITYAATIAAVIMLMVKGIKFIISAPEGKAEVKKELMPWVIGVIILFSASVIVNFVVDFAQNNVNNITL